jgi:capsule polysaccharide export protein KpsE/RkpR
LKKTEEKIKKAQQKLEQIKVEFEQKSELLNGLIEKRAGLLADFEVESDKRVKKEIDDMTTKIDELKFYKEGKPELITALQAKIESLKKQKEGEAQQININQQKKIVKEIEVTSAALLAALEDALKINNNLQELWAKNNGLTNVTKTSIPFSTPATTGSQQSLEHLCSIIRGELSGQGRKDRVFRNVFI